MILIAILFKILGKHKKTNHHDSVVSVGISFRLQYVREPALGPVDLQDSNVAAFGDENVPDDVSFVFHFGFS
jgi:hypothetical protein